jgi:site-specific DNA-methyltransferase (adenine-specific)
MPEPYWSDEDVTLYLGKCEDVLLSLPDNSVDSIVTDPPYGLEFMGAEWDTFRSGDGFRRSRNEADAGRDSVFGRTSRTSPEYISGGRLGKQPVIGDADGTPFRRNEGTPSWAASGNPRCSNCGGTKYDRTRPNGCACGAPSFPVESAPQMYAFQAWCQAWAAECLRVLKPGGWMLAFGSTRTSHRLKCGIEDAGFEIRDTVAELTGQDAPEMMWVYGQGMPKSLDAARAMDMTVCTLPGKHCMRRVPDEPKPGDHVCPESEEGLPWKGWGTALAPAWEPVVVARKPLAGTLGRNLLEHGTGALNIDECRVEGIKDVPASPRRAPQGPAYGDLSNDPGTGSGFDPNIGRWPPNVVLGPGAAAELDRQSGVLTSGANPARRGSDKFRDAYGEFAGQEECVVHRGANSGGASRFFPVFKYQAKATSAERPRLPDGTRWPTVKPLPLIRYLVRLVTPPRGTVLDLFAGSGTTAEACIIEGFPCILVDKDPVAAELIMTRLAKPIQPTLFGLDEAS